MCTRRLATSITNRTYSRRRVIVSTQKNRLHWVRDVTFTEDLSQIRTAAGPAVMATLRNLAISLHRLAGATNIAAACRHISRHPNHALPLLL